MSKMFVSVFVPAAFVPAATDRPANVGDEIVCMDREQSLHLIGILPGFAIGDLASFEKAKAELANHGVSLGVLVLESRCGNDIGVITHYAVEVSDMRDARDLPGFVNFGMWSGYQKMLPEALG